MTRPERSEMPAATALVLAELGRIVLADTPLDQMLTRVVELARDAVPPATDVSVTLLVNDRPTTAAFTSDRALDLDERQYEQGYGPCLDAARGGEVMIIDDMATESRWPEYAPIALGRGIGSSVSVALPVQEHIVGALNVYSDEKAALIAMSAAIPPTAPASAQGMFLMI